MGSSSRFWDRIADRYAASPVKDEDAYRTKLATTREHFTPETVVLELGCGTGSTAIAHAPHVAHIRATDISARMLEIARAKARAAGVTNVTFEQAAAGELDAPAGSFDAILAHSLLHLLPDCRPALADINRWLKPGGVFVSSTACLGDTMWWFWPIGAIGRALGFFPLVRVFTRRRLEACIAAAGFELDHVWQPGRGKAVFIVARKPVA